MAPVRKPCSSQPRSRDVAQSDQPVMVRREPPPGLNPRHMAIWERLQQLKRAQLEPPRQLKFDEAKISVEEDNVSYEHIVYTEFSDEDEPLSILNNTAMGYSGATVDVLPGPAQADLEKAQILLEHEMETDDIFGKSNIADPDIMFEDIAVEKEGDSSCSKKVKVGMRKLNVQGEEPLVESYMEESNQPLFDGTLIDEADYTTPISDSMLNVILDQKLKEL